jgi:hypothetical protein
MLNGYTDKVKEVPMFIANDYELKKEQYKDLLREAEKERLIRQVSENREKSANSQKEGGLLLKVFHAEKHSPALMSFKNADTGACK